MLSEAMILAAGRGSRLDPITQTLPKPMVQVGGRSLIDYRLEALAAAGVQTVIINSHYHAEQLRTHVEQLTQQYELDLIFVHEQQQALETAGGIANALTYFQQDYFMVCNADIWTDYPIEHLLQQPLKKQAHLVLVPNPPDKITGDFGLLDTSPFANQVLTTTPDYTFAGIGLYHRSLFDGVNLQQPTPLAPLIRASINKHQVTGELYEGQWYDVGTHVVLKQLNQACV